MSDVPSWIVVESRRLEDGRLEIVYSFAPGKRYTAVIVPGTDAAAAIRQTGEVLSRQWHERGYL